MSLPRLYIFNPTCDFAVANGSPSWQPNATLSRMEEDMASIVRFLSNPEDLVLVNRLPSNELYRVMESVGFPQPRFRTFDSYSSTPEPIKEIRPWGWSPAFNRMIATLTEAGKYLPNPTGVSPWLLADKELRSRQTSLNALHHLLKSHFHDNFISLDMISKVYNNKVEIETYAATNPRLLLKLPWSSSGRGLIPITETPVHQSVKQQINSALKSQGYLMAEPFLDKVHDLAFLFQIDQGEIRFLGISRFFTNHKGQYQGNNLGGFPVDIPEEEKEFLKWAIDLLPGLLTKILYETGLAEAYSGPLGIDTLIFRDKEGKLKINPCLEINWRYTMGHISLELEKYLNPSSYGIFRTWHGKGKTFTQWVGEQSPQHKICNNTGKIISGFIPLTEFKYNNQFGAWLEVIPKKP